MREDLVEVVRESFYLGLAELEISEAGHIPDLIFRDLHAVALLRACRYTMRKTGSSIRSDSSRLSGRRVSRCGGRRCLAIRNSRSAIKPGPNRSWTRRKICICR